MKPVLELPTGTHPFNWFTFSNSLLGWFPLISADEVPEAALGPGETSKETEQNYRRAETPFVAEIENVIRTLCESGSASVPSKLVAYFLPWRSTTVMAFLLKLSISFSPYRYLSIIPSPPLPTTVCQTKTSH